MSPGLSAHTQAILLLTAPLLAGSGVSSPALVTPSEFKRLDQLLRENGSGPANLLAPDAAALIHACRSVIEEDRLRRLLGRGFLLSQAFERWQSRAIWVLGRADLAYPSRLTSRLGDDAPVLLYGCGEASSLEAGGLAVIGSRNADEVSTTFATRIGHLAANAGKTLVSGGAKGIDRAAMLGALEGGGNAIGVLADSLERGATSRDYRDMIIDGRLVLISPYDPGAGFNVGNAMQRNKLIYALADASLVVSSDFQKGGTWAGAVEQLDKLRTTPVYVRPSPKNSAGVAALIEKGAIPWPDPEDANALNSLLEKPAPENPEEAQPGLSLFSDAGPRAPAHAAMLDPPPAAGGVGPAPPQLTDLGEEASLPGLAAEPSVAERERGERSAEPTKPPAEALLAVVREVFQRLLVEAMKAAEIAAALEISASQAKAWLERFVDEGMLEKKKRPDRYILKQSRLFD